MATKKTASAKTAANVTAAETRTGFDNTGPENRGPENRDLSKEELRELRYIESVLDGEQAHLQALYGHYIYNLLRHTKRDSAMAHRIAVFMEARLKGASDIKFPQQQAKGVKTSYYDRGKQGSRVVGEEDWQALTTYFGQFKEPAVIPEEDEVFKNLIRLTDILGLGAEEKKPLGLLYVAKQHEAFADFLMTVFDGNLRKASMGIARMLDTPLEGRKVLAALNPGSKLNRYGLTYFQDIGPTTEIGLPVIEDEIIEKFDQVLSDSEIAAVLLGKPMVSQLGVEDFSHVGEQLDFVLNLIKRSAESGEKGINIFLHGPAGSGKTELAAALAKHLEMRLFSIGEPEQEDGTEYTVSGTRRPASEVRISQLQRTLALLDGSKNSIVLFDEIEDLLMKGTDSSKSADTDNKLLVNRLLESNPVVTIWTGNNPEKFHEAVRQRFSYSILMDYPPTLVREKIWKRRLEMENVTMPEADTRMLAREYAAPARMISKAVRTMRIIDGDMNDIRRSLEADSKIAFGESDSILVEDRIPGEFSLDVLDADKNLPDMFNRLVRRGAEKKPFSLLLQADPDSGAEHFLRSVAEDIVMNPYETSIASLCEPHPMVTPAQKFRDAFEGAADTRQFLIIRGLEDLAGAEGDTPDWRGGYTELFSYYALKHKVPFAVIAKRDVQLPERMAMLFSDRVEIRPMTSGQATRFYEQIFGEAVPEAHQKSLNGLGMADFLKTRDFLVRLDQEGGLDHGRVVELLTQFKNRRVMDKKRSIGFAH